MLSRPRDSWYISIAIVVYLASYASDRLRLRSPFIFAGLIIMLIGVALSISNTSNGVKYCGGYWIAIGAFTSLPGIIAWYVPKVRLFIHLTQRRLGNNLSGQYKRGMGMGIQIGIGNLCAIFAANMYRDQDAPRYILGGTLSHLL
jgi:hypothetical protein